MTFGRSRPSAHRRLTVSPIRRVAARCGVPLVSPKQVVTQVGGGEMGTLREEQLEQVAQHGQFADGQKCPAGTNCQLGKTPFLISGEKFP